MWTGSTVWAPGREGATASLSSLGCRWADVARGRLPTLESPKADSAARRGVGKGPGTDHGGPKLSPHGDTPSRPQARTAIDTTLPHRSHRPNDRPYSSSATEVVIR